MTVKLKVAKKSTVATPQSTSKKSRSKTSAKPIPERPSPKRPKAVKSYASGKRLVVRFTLSKYMGHNPWNPKQRGDESPWYVTDMDTGQIAKGSDRKGYEDKAEAAKVARKLRNKYGAYAKVPF